MKWIILIFVSFSLIFALPSTAAEKDKISYQRALDDETIEKDFAEGLRWQDQRFIDARVKVKVFNGYVLIYGEVPEKDLIAIAEEHARQLNNVRRVFSQLRVGKNRILNTMEDLLLNINIKAHLLTSINTDATKIRYEVDGSTVYLMGLLTAEEAGRTVALVEQIKSVDKVVTLFEYIK